MLNVMIPPVQYHTEKFHSPNNPLCCTYQSFSPSSQSLATTDLFIVFIVSPFPKCHKIEIIQIGFFLLTIVFSFQHVFSGLIALSLMLLNIITLYECPTAGSSICTLKDILVAYDFWQLPIKFL